MNNKSKNKLAQLDSEAKRLQTWNYKVAYDGQTKFKPPVHSIPTKPKQKPKPVTNSEQKSGNCRFVVVQDVEEDVKPAAR